MRIAAATGSGPPTSASVRGSAGAMRPTSPGGESHAGGGSARQKRATARCVHGLGSPSTSWPAPPSTTRLSPGAAATSSRAVSSLVRTS